MIKFLLITISLFLCQNAFADFNSGDVFGKGIIVQSNGTTVTGGGRVLNFASGTNVTTVNNKYQITASSSATIGGSISVSEVAYGSGTNAITGNPNFEYDGTNLIFGNSGSLEQSFGQWSISNVNGAISFDGGGIQSDGSSNVTQGGALILNTSGSFNANVFEVEDQNNNIALNVNAIDDSVSLLGDLVLNNTVPFATPGTQVTIYNDGDTYAALQMSQANPGGQLTSYTASVDSSAYMSANGSYLNFGVREGLNGTPYSGFSSDNTQFVQMYSGNGVASLGLNSDNTMFGHDGYGSGFSSDGVGGLNFTGNIGIDNATVSSFEFQIGDINQDTLVMTVDGGTQDFIMGDISAVNYGNILELNGGAGYLLYTVSGISVFGIDNSNNATFYYNLNLNNATASRVAGFDASKNLISLATTTYPSLTELAFVKGVTSAIQTQINSKGSGTVTSVTASSPLSSSGGTTPNITVTSSTGSGAIVLATSPTITTPIFSGNSKISSGVFLRTQTSAPTIASNGCGTTTQGTVASGSTDEAFSITAGTLSLGSVLTCTMTFGQSHTSAPTSCACQDGTTPLALSATQTNTTVTCTALATLAGATVTGNCAWTAA